MVWKERTSQFRAWSARQAARARDGARWTWGKVSAAPWRRIGIWTGGVFGVLVVALVLFVGFADWNALKGPISRFASAASGREIVIRGDLDVEPWSLTPVFRVTNTSIGNPERFHDRGVFAQVERAEAAVQLSPLLIGRLDITRLEVNGADVSLYRNAEGDANWARAPNSTRGRLPNLPAIRRFSLRDGNLRLEDDKRRIVLEAEFNTEEDAAVKGGGSFELAGEGRINDQPFSLELTGPPLLNVRRDRPYRFVADVRAGETHLIANGSIRRPFDFGAFTADVDATGADLADLYYLIGLALPNTPPYALSGRVERVDGRYGMPNLAGRVGDSDIRGAFTATRQRNGRLFFDGDFATRSLDFDDLMTVLGGAPDTGETASAEQRAIAANLAGEGRLLPDAPLDISRVRNMDARVSYRAAHVRSDRLPLRGLAVDVGLDNGMLRLDPLTLELARGRIGGAVAINAREQVPHVDLDMRLSGARLEFHLPYARRAGDDGRLDRARAPQRPRRFCARCGRQR